MSITDAQGAADHRLRTGDLEEIDFPLKLKLSINQILKKIVNIMSLLIFKLLYLGILRVPSKGIEYETGI